MIRQVSDVPDVIQNAAKEYVSSYLRDHEVRGNHLTFMRTCDQCENRSEEHTSELQSH